MEINNNESVEIVENLEKLECMVLKYEISIQKGEEDISLVHYIFRYAHNLKGILRMVHFEGMSGIIHLIESKYDAIRSYKCSGSNELTELTIEAIDLVASQLREGREDSIKNQAFIDKINLLKDKNHKPLSLADWHDGFDAEEKKVLDQAIHDGERLLLIQKLIGANFSNKEVLELPVFNDIRKIGRLIAYYPKFDYEMPHENEEVILKILFSSGLAKYDLDRELLTPYQEVHYEGADALPVADRQESGITPSPGVDNADAGNNAPLKNTLDEMHIDKKINGDGLYLSIAGNLTIDTIHAFYSMAAGDYPKYREMILDLNKIENIDLSAIQLLFCVYKTACTDNKKLILKGKQNESVLANLALSAFFNPYSSGKPVGNTKALKKYNIVISPTAKLFTTGLDLIAVFREIESLGALNIKIDSRKIPLLQDIRPDYCYASWDLALETDAEMNAVKDKLVFLEYDKQSVVQVGIEKDPDRPGSDHESPVPQNIPAESLKSPNEQKSGRKSDADKDFSVRVATQKLDKILNQVGELVILQSQLSRITRNINDKGLADISESMERLTGELRSASMEVRMVPVSMLFGRFKRLVRDLGIMLKKEVSLTIEGEETELDKTAIERLYDPMVHIIRNAMDHGIESPDIREKAGKTRDGRIRLNACQAGSEVIITVADDGAGIDRKRVLDKAVQKGIIPAASDLTEKQIFELLFHHGFSTTEEVSEVSGRGVGLDVVKNCIDSFRGSVDISSITGKGTTMTIRFPLTMAIIEGLLLKVDAEHFIIPLTCIEECLDLNREMIDSCSEQKITNFRGSPIPFFKLRKYLGLPEIGLPDEQMIIVKNKDNKFIGFTVDKIIGQYQTVIKSLGQFYTKREELSGATILADGKIALILDVQNIFENFVL